MEIPFLGTVDFAHPWYLAAGLPPLLLLFVRSGGFIRIAGDIRRPALATRLRFVLPLLFLAAAIVAASLALAGIGGGYTREVRTRDLVGRILVTQDQSGSMFTILGSRNATVPVMPAPLRCVFADEVAEIAREGMTALPEPPSGNSPFENARLYRLWSGAWSLETLPKYPRIDGSCKAAEALLDELSRRVTSSQGVHHEVGYARFATTSVIHEPLTIDYQHLRRALSSMDWRSADASIGASTNINLALYDLFMAAFRRHIDAEPPATPIPGTLLNELMVNAVNRHGPPEVIDDILARYSGIAEKLRAELSDTVIILITDAETVAPFNELPSLGRMLRIAERFGIPVFILSTEGDNLELRQTLPLTGTPERPGAFFLLNKLEGYASMADDMRTILDRALTRRREEVVVVRKNYAPLAAGIAVLLAVASFLMKESAFGRRVTG